MISKKNKRKFSRERGERNDFLFDKKMYDRYLNSSTILFLLRPYIDLSAKRETLWRTITEIREVFLYNEVQTTLMLHACHFTRIYSKRFIDTTSPKKNLSYFSTNHHQLLSKQKLFIFLRSGSEWPVTRTVCIWRTINSWSSAASTAVLQDEMILRLWYTV